MQLLVFNYALNGIHFNTFGAELEGGVCPGGAYNRMHFCLQVGGLITGEVRGLISRGDYKGQFTVFSYTTYS